MRQLAAIAVLMLAFGAAPPSYAVTEPLALADGEVLKTQVDRDERMTVPVRIGEQNTFTFIIDTGSQTTVLARSIAERLALPSSRRANIVGIGGRETADTVVVRELGLGRRSFQNMEVVLFEAHDIGADGIVGIDSLQRQRVLLDFARHQFTVGDVRSEGGNKNFDIVVTARRRLGQLIMTDAVIDGVRADVIIDTGAETSIGNTALKQTLDRRRAAVQETVSLLSVTGQTVTGELGFPRKLTIGDFDINNLLVAYLDSPVFEVLKLNRRPALLLGMRELRLFKRVAIDFAAHKIYFDLPQVGR
jgi:predicted aspartyl protease